MVGGRARHVKARCRLGIAHLLRAVERRIAGEPQRIAAEHGLLVHDSDVYILDKLARGSENVVVVARAVRTLAAHPHALVHEHIAHHGDGHAPGHGDGVLNGRKATACRGLTGARAATQKVGRAPRKSGERQQRCAAAERRKDAPARNEMRDRAPRVRTVRCVARHILLHGALHRRGLLPPVYARRGGAVNRAHGKCRQRRRLHSLTPERGSRLSWAFSPLGACPESPRQREWHR